MTRTPISDTRPQPCARPRPSAFIGRTLALWLLLAPLTHASPSSTSTVEYRFDAAGNIVEIEVSGELQVLGFAPLAAPPSATVFVRGTGFDPNPEENRVFVGNVQAQIVSGSRRELQILVPAGATSAPVIVESPSGRAQSVQTFEVLSDFGPPLIEIIKPQVLLAGSELVLEGHNFVPDPSANEVTAGVRTANVRTATSARLVINLPASTGSGRVQVSTPHGRATSAQHFFVPPSPRLPADVTQTKVVAHGESVPVQINAAGKIALFAFEVVQATQAEVTVTQNSIGDVTIVLLAPDGSRLASQRSTLTGFKIPLVDLALPGSYTVAVMPEGASQGSMTLQVGAPDLSLSDVSYGSLSANADGTYSIPITYTVSNIGSVTAATSWYDMAYLSTDSVLSNNDFVLSTPVHRTAPLTPGASYTVTRVFKTSNSVAAGLYTVFVRADGAGGVYGGAVTAPGRIKDANASNGVASFGVTLP